MSVRQRTRAKKAAHADSPCVCMGFGPEISRVLRGLGNDGAKNHFRTARVEVLKGLRALIDQRIESLSKRSGRGATIKVE